MASQFLFEPLVFDNPGDWFTRLEAAHSLLEASTGNTISLKTYLLATIGSKGSILIADLLAPVTIQDASVTYAQVKTTLLQHMKSQHLEIAERSNFYAAHQGPAESASNFYGRLKKLSEFCNFGVSLDAMLRDRLVLGCRSIEARKKLLQIDPLTLQQVRDHLSVYEAIEMARSGALADTGEIHSTKPQNFNKSNFNSNFNKFRTNTSKPRSCLRCGRQGCKGSSRCPAMGKTCKSCGKLNHFQSVCLSKPNQASVNHSTHSLMHVDVVPTHNVDEKVVMRLNGHTALMEVDTGAAVTLISTKMWRAMGKPTLAVSNSMFSAYDGHLMKPVGDLVDCRIETDAASIVSTITVVEATKQYGLLGRDVLDNFRLRPVMAVNSTEDIKLPAMKVEPVSIEVLDDSKLRFCKARPVPLPMVEQVNQELERLQTKGIIKPVSSSRCASPVVWVKKRNGSLRMCADFKTFLNPCITSDAYPLPAIETIFAGMKNSKVFAKLDLKEAYWQIPLDANSRELCTINTSKGLYQMTRLPKGMKNSAAVFQRVIESLLRGIAGVVVYQDDILVHAPTSDQLAKHLNAVFRRLEEKGVTVNQSKSVLNTPEVKFLGHLVSSAGISPDPDIAKKIQSFKPPTTRSELESFLGLINYFGRMIPNYSRIVQPLHSLRKKDEDFNWSEPHQQAFDRVLQVMASPPVLQSYDLLQPVTLTTDASEKAIGGVLTQDGKPVMFVSRVLTPTEQRYSNIEREALAVVWSVLRLRQLLLGRHFMLITDHRPLEKIYGGRSIPKVASNRLTRWSIILQRYDFSIQYKPGTEIKHADALTRLHLLCDRSDKEDIVINNVASDVSDEWVQTLQQAMEADELGKSIVKRLQSSNWRSIQPNERPFFRISGQLTVRDGLIYFNNKCYIPRTARRDVFDSCHQLHTGIHSTVNRIKLSSWWPTIQSDVQRWIRSCSTCCKLRPSYTKSLSPWPTAGVFERVHMDWCHIPDIGNVLVLVDSASGWIECSLPQARTTSNVIDTMSAIFCRFGIPRILVTDNAAEFTSQELNYFCQTNGITKMESPPYHSESNGVAERGVQTVKNGMKAWRMDVSHLSFKEYLKRLLLHHRACFKRPDGRTPAEVVYGRKIRIPLSRNFLFSQPVQYKSRDGALRDAAFLLERGSNTSWVLDAADNRLRLAHDNQLSRLPEDSTPEPDDEAAQPTFDPDETIPMVTSPSPTTSTPVRRSPRVQRSRKKRVVTDYNDL